MTPKSTKPATACDGNGLYFSGVSSETQQHKITDKLPTFKFCEIKYREISKLPAGTIELMRQNFIDNGYKILPNLKECYFKQTPYVKYINSKYLRSKSELLMDGGSHVFGISRNPIGTIVLLSYFDILSIDRRFEGLYNNYKPFFDKIKSNPVQLKYYRREYANGE